MKSLSYIAVAVCMLVMGSETSYAQQQILQQLDQQQIQQRVRDAIRPQAAPAIDPGQLQPLVRDLGARSRVPIGPTILPGQASVQSLSVGPIKMGLGESTPAHKNLMTKTVDFRAAIAKLAEEKKLSGTDARLEALMLLRLNPCRRELRTESSGATFELVDVDQFEITADEEYFEQLPYLISCLNLGMKQVAIQCQVIQIDSKSAKRMNSFLHSTEINCGTIPAVAPVATAQPAAKVSAASFVTTSTVVRENSPATTGQLSAKQLGKLAGYLKRSKADIQMAPTVVTYPGQTGTISNVSDRPFVVGLEKIQVKGMEADVFKPLVQTIGDGTTLKVRGIPRDGSIQLLGDVSMAEIIDLNSFTFATVGKEGQQSIQVPRQVLRQIHFSATLEPDVGYYIDPNFETEGPEGKVRTVFLFQAKMIDMHPVRVAEKK